MSSNHPRVQARASEGQAQLGRVAVGHILRMRPHAMDIEHLVEVSWTKFAQQNDTLFYLPKEGD